MRASKLVSRIERKQPTNEKGPPRPAVHRWAKSPPKHKAKPLGHSWSTLVFMADNNRSNADQPCGIAFAAPSGQLIVIWSAGVFVVPPRRTPTSEITWPKPTAQIKRSKLVFEFLLSWECRWVAWHGVCWVPTWAVCSQGFQRSCKDVQLINQGSIALVDLLASLAECQSRCWETKSMLCHRSTHITQCLFTRRTGDWAVQVLTVFKTFHGPTF